MAFVVETGQGLTNSNAYISPDFYRDYHTLRGRDISSQTDEQIQAKIILATDYVDIVREEFFRGIRQVQGQSLAWPRIDAVYDDGYSIHGVPREVQEATAEYAFIVTPTESLAPNITYNETGQLATEVFEKVDVIETLTRYQDNGSIHSIRQYPIADNLLNRVSTNGLGRRSLNRV